MINGQSVLGLLWGSSSTVIANNAPGWMKLAGKIAHVFVGNAVGVCDGVNDEVEVLAAMNALTNGGTVHLSAGTFHLGATLATVSNVALSGDGIDSTILYEDNAINAQPLIGRLPTGAPPAQTNVEIRNLTINGNAAGQTVLGYGILIANTTGVWIHNIRVTGTMMTAIAVVTSSAVKITDNLIDTIGTGAFEANAISIGGYGNVARGSDFLVQGNSISGITNGCGVDVVGASLVRVVDNNIATTGQPALRVMDTPSAPSMQNTDIVMSGNNITMTTNTQGIYCADVLRLTISYNTITQTQAQQVIYVVGDATGAHATGNNSTEVAIVGNTIVMLAANHGIHINADATYVRRFTIADNVVTFDSTAGGRYGISIENCNGGTVSGNTVYQSGYALRAIGTASYNVFSGNIIDSALRGYHENAATADHNRFIGNTFINSSNLVTIAGPHSVALGNTGYISPGEERSISALLTKTGSTFTNLTGTAAGSPITLIPGANVINITGDGTFTIVLPAGSTGSAASGTATVTGGPIALTGGSQVIACTGSPGNITVTVNAIGVAIACPEAQNCMVRRVVVDITTPGGTATSVIQVGEANDAIGTGLGAQFFTAIDANAAAIRDSFLAGDTGAQTKFVAWPATGANSYVVAQFQTQIANNLVGRVTVFYCGR